MATTGFGTLTSGIANVASLKCCCPACCRWCADTNLCVSYTSATNGVWDCSFGGPTGTVNITTPVTIGSITRCDGGTHYDTATWHYLRTVSAPGFGLLTTEVTVALTKNPDTGVCTLTVTIYQYCQSTFGDFPAGSSVTYVGTYTLPTTSSGCFDYSGGLGITANLTDYTHSDPATTQPSTLAVTITPGTCGTGVVATPLSAQTETAATTTAMRSLPCVSLGERIEFRAGCSTGWMCRHACTSSRPDVVAHLGGVSEAVPGDDCQTCPGYSARC